MVNHLIGFGAGGPIVRTQGSVISGGTNIGDMTGTGGLAASFDGTTNQAGAACSTRSSVANGYVGKTITKRVFKLIAYGSNNNGFQNSNTATTITLYGKTGSAPANGTDGTSLGSVNFTDTTNESAGRTVTSSDNETLWDHLWMYISIDGGGSNNLFSAECELYESV